MELYGKKKWGEEKKRKIWGKKERKKERKEKRTSTKIANDYENATYDRKMYLFLCIYFSIHGNYSMVTEKKAHE